MKIKKTVTLSLDKKFIDLVKEYKEKHFLPSFSYTITLLTIKGMEVEKEKK